MKSPNPPVSKSKFLQVFSNLDKRGVTYGFGVKAPSLSCDTSLIHAIDCSGFSRYSLAKASFGKWIIPDGSQDQLAYFEANDFHHLTEYQNVVLADVSRMFICFIKPFTNGCGSVGHVWIVTKLHPNLTPRTFESHGGRNHRGIDPRLWNDPTLYNHRGIDSRLWNYPTLYNQVYATFEICATS